MSGTNSAPKFQTGKKRNLKQLFKRRVECNFANKVPLQKEAINDYLVENIVHVNIPNNYKIDDYNNIITNASKIKLNNEYMTLDFIGWSIKRICNGDNKIILDFFLLLLELKEELNKFGYTWEILTLSRLRISILRNIYYNFKLKNSSKTCKENYEIFENAFAILGVQADKIFGISCKDHINALRILKNVPLNEMHLQEEHIKRIFALLDITDDITVAKLDVIIKLFNIKKTREITFIKELSEKYSFNSKQNILTNNFLEVIEIDAINSQIEHAQPLENEETTIEPIEIDTNIDNQKLSYTQKNNEENEVLEKLFSLIEGGVKHNRDNDYEHSAKKAQKINESSNITKQSDLLHSSPLIKFTQFTPPCSPILWKGEFDDKNFPPIYKKLKKSL